MGQKNSAFHSQLRNPSESVSCDLVDHHVASSSMINPTDKPYVQIKHGPFRRKISMRNISIRRSLNLSKNSRRKHHEPLRNEHSLHQKIGASATTDLLPSNSLNNNFKSQKPILINGNAQTSSYRLKSINNDQSQNSNPSSVLPLPKSVKSGNQKFVMDRLRKSFRNSFRKRKNDVITESQKPHQWQSDEHSVRAGTCVFAVNYLGCVEVYESRGMQICEDALRTLRNSKRRGIKGQLYVTGDGIRVVDNETKGLVVDQTIEKVSFCAPDRSHERGFSYICRDGTTRRWMCHGFLALKDSGERLSHAVGCAFNICLEKKQKRDKESVNAILDVNNFVRTGSFRQTSITERLQDPQVAKPYEPVPLKPIHNPHAVARPHATANLLQRQGSLRGGPLNASPFKRQLSLRLNMNTDLSKSIESSPINSPDVTEKNSKKRAQSLDLVTFEDMEMTSEAKSPLPEQDSMITAMCQELTQGLSILSAQNENYEIKDWDGQNSSPTSSSAAIRTSPMASDNNNMIGQSNENPSNKGFDSFFSLSKSGEMSSQEKSLCIKKDTLGEQFNEGSIDSGIALSSSMKSTVLPSIMPIDQIPKAIASPLITSSLHFSSSSDLNASSDPKSINNILLSSKTMEKCKSPTNNLATINSSQIISTCNNPFLLDNDCFQIKTVHTNYGAQNFKSTNPFLNLSDSEGSITKAKSSDPFDDFHRETEDLTTNSPKANTLSSINQPMVKAFEVSM